MKVNVALSLVIWGIVLIHQLFILPASSQRTIANLGKRIKRQVGQRSNAQEAGIDAAGTSTTSYWKNITGVEWDEKSVLRQGGILLATLVVSVFVMVQTHRERRRRMDYDAETSMHGEKVEIAFENIKLELDQGKRKGKRLILDGSIRGKATPGRLLAIMGPSGSGKSTLLDALAGKIKYSPKLNLSGRRFLNGEAVSGDSQLPAAYIEQDSNFFPHMTTQEVLEFRVELKLGKMPASKKNAIVQQLMEQLNLVNSADTVVGNAKIRGLSGGERKRLSIACEMISSPSAIFLDEPTSGLDSFQAMQVIQTLRALADDSGKTIVAVIHQPSQLAFNYFDDLLLLSEGRQVYFGPRQDVRAHLENMGYEAPAEMGTAEHVLDCISKITSGGAEAEKESLKRIDALARKAAATEIEMPELDVSTTRRFAPSKRGPRANIFRQFWLLLGRSLNEAFRGKGAIIIKIVQQVSLGLIYGGIYQLSNNQSSIQDRVGLLSLIAISATNMGMAGTLRSFPKEKSIVSKEMSSKMYATLPYFLAKAIAEIPLIGALTTMFSSIVYSLTGLQKLRSKFQTFLGLVSLHSIAAEAAGLVIGAVAPSEDVALALFPAVIVLNIIFDGKNIADESTPRILRWIPKVGLIRWGFEGLILNEFEGLHFDTSGPRRGPVTKTGEDAIARLGFEGHTVGNVFRVQGTIIAACWLMSYAGLAFTRQKFMKMVTPVS